MLTARLLCCEALMILRSVRHVRVTSAKLPDNAETINPVAGLFGLNILIEDADLGMKIDGFDHKHLVPTIRAWAPTFYGVELGDQPLLTPLGVMDCKTERYDGVAMRCIIIEHQPVGERNVPSREAKYYDISDDEWKEGLCSMSVSFWVHTPDTAARMLGAE